MPEWLRGLLPGRAKRKAAATREGESERDEARLQSAFEFGQRLAEEIGPDVQALIDRYFRERVIPGVAKLNEVVDRRMKATHHQSEGAVLAEFDYCLDFIEHARSRFEAEVAEDLDKIEMLETLGVRDMFDRQVATRLDSFRSEMIEQAKDAAAYALARSRGMITDDQDAMSLDELRKSLNAKDAPRSVAPAGRG